MRSNIRGILIFLLAFLIGAAAVPPPARLLDVPPITDEPPLARFMECDMGVQTPATSQISSFTIDIRRRSADSILEERSITVKPGGPRVTNIDLEFGESIENELIVLRSLAKQAYKVEMQFENSMAIGDEGPHLDLLEWKHHISPWKEIKATADNTYLVPEIPEADLTRFPKVTTNEIVAAFRKTGAEKRWLDLARTCTGPNSGPCYVAPSRLSLRISVKENNRWRIVHTINFSIPMGC